VAVDWNVYLRNADDIQCLGTSDSTPFYSLSLVTTSVNIEVNAWFMSDSQCQNYMGNATVVNGHCWSMGGEPITALKIVGRNTPN